MESCVRMANTRSQVGSRQLRRKRYQVLSTYLDEGHTVVRSHIFFFAELVILMNSMIHIHAKLFHPLRYFIQLILFCIFRFSLQRHLKYFYSSYKYVFNSKCTLCVFISQPFFFFYSKIHSAELLGGRSRVFCGTRILWHIWPSSHLSEQESSENYLALLSFSHSDTHRSLSR